MFSDVDIASMALWFVAFLISATCHEAGHALVARLGGDSTAYHAGQVSLNPWPHLKREPVGMVLVPLVSYLMQNFMIGWASAPYDPDWADRHPRRAALMAAAGPAANLLLVAGAVGAMWVLKISGVGAMAVDVELVDALFEFLQILAYLNAVLMVFNLIPVPPLDGAAVLEGFGGAAVKRVMVYFRSMPMAGLFGLVMAWQIFGWVAPWVFGAVGVLISVGL